MKRGIHWELAWENYPGKSDIVPRSDLSTFITGYKSLEASKSATAALARLFERKGYSVAYATSGEQDSPEDNITVASKGVQRILFRDDCGYLPIRCPLSLRTDVLDYTLNHGRVGRVFTGEVVHGVKRRVLAGLGTVTERIGNVDSSDEIDLYPYEFIELRRGRTLVAKMLVSHHNYDMGEFAPTMELLEVVESERGKGFGSRMIGLVETEAKERGFDRVWGTDANLSHELLEKLGYECDLDEECVKYLR